MIDWVTSAANIYFSQFWRLGSPRSRCHKLRCGCYCSVTQSCLTLCDPHELQHTRLPCPSPSPRVCSSSCLLSHDAIHLSHPLLPLLLLPSVFLSIRVFSSASAVCTRWPKYWSFSFSISPCNEYSGLISLGWTCWIFLQSKGCSNVFSNTTAKKHEFLHTQLSLWSNSPIQT